MRQPAALLALGATLALVVVFCMGGGTSPVTTSYSPMEGKTIASNVPPAPPPPPASPTPPPPPAPKPVVTKRRSSPAKRRQARAQPLPAPPPSVPAVSTQAVAPAAAPLPAPEKPSLTYDAIADKYENDPSVYSMDRAVRVGDLTLRLKGLECLAEAFVLKVEVGNDSNADFYVKTFVVQSGAKSLVSRYFFRILVESQRAREGYVVFQKPQNGAAVKIKIEEEGGKGRAVSAAIPYPF